MGTLYRYATGVTPNENSKYVLVHGSTEQIRMTGFRSREEARSAKRSIELPHTKKQYRIGRVSQAVNEGVIINEFVR